ncbi:MAG TPA: LCP family protein [Chloroflexota bacterium]|nr:LCP family protein [Chloroflexota bacterium]
MPRFQLRQVLGTGRTSARVARVAVVVLAIYALGLIPFFFLTPVHQAVLSLFHPAPVAQAQPNGKPARSATTPTNVADGPTPKATPNDTAIVTARSTAAPGETPAPVPVQLAGGSHFAFLLLGYGGGNHEGPYLTDSMMLVIVDAEKKTLTLVSIPRDSWVPMLFDGQNATYSKINTAYAFAEDPSLYPDRLTRYSGTEGAGNFTMDTVARLTGVPINYYLGLDFEGFKQMIDAVGGIDVDVPDSFSALYPVNDDPTINAAYETVSFTEGVQHMDGTRALEFARTRQTLDNVSEGSDFARSRRQRLIIEAFKSRVLQPGGLIHLPQVLAIANEHVATNYAIPAAAQLSQLALNWKDVKIYQTALTTANYLEEATGPEGTYAEVPNSPDHSWTQIQGFSKMLWDDPAAGVDWRRPRLR